MKHYLFEHGSTMEITEHEATELVASRTIYPCEGPHNSDLRGELSIYHLTVGLTMTDFYNKRGTINAQTINRLETCWQSR